MVDSFRRVLPPQGTDDKRLVAEVANNAINGRINSVSTLTLTAGTTTTVTDFRAGGNSFIGLTPLDANAAAITGLYVSSRDKQSFDLTHSTAAGTESFVYVVLG